MGAREDLTMAAGQAESERTWEGIRPGWGEGSMKSGSGCRSLGRILVQMLSSRVPLASFFFICQMGMISIPGAIGLL